jgi:hypothetical protein
VHASAKVCNVCTTERQATKEDFMKLRTVSKLAVLAIAVSAALPALADTSVSVEHGKHHYVFYSDKDIYYSPESHKYFWVEGGKWQSGMSLPREEQDYVVRAKGIDIDLDTEVPYERNDYVVKTYRGGGDVAYDAAVHYVGGRTLTNGRPTSETTRTERTVNDDGSTTTTTTTRRSYVYYGDHDIYFAPDRKVYYWRDNGRWISGSELPPAFAGYVRSGGVNIELDTDRPYERNEYVIAHYGHRHHDRDDE